MVEIYKAHSKNYSCMVEAEQLFSGEWVFYATYTDSWIHKKEFSTVQGAIEFIQSTIVSVVRENWLGEIDERKEVE